MQSDLLKILLFCLLLPAFGIFASDLWMHKWYYSHPLTLSLLITTEAFLLLCVAALNYLRVNKRLYTDKDFFLITSALICIGTLHGFLALMPTGKSGVLMHHLVQGIGGLFFCALYFSNKIKLTLTRLPFFTFAASMIFGLVIYTWSDSLLSESFSHFISLLAWLGSIGFIVSAIHLMQQFSATNLRGYYLLAIFGLLFGATGILFLLYPAWNAGWWWYILRLGTCFFLIFYLLNNLQLISSSAIPYELLSHRIVKESSAKLLSFLIFIFGCTIILGWHTENVSLIRLIPMTSPMPYNAALCFVLLAIALWTLRRETPIAQIAASMVIIIAGLTLFEYLFLFNFGIDEFFVTQSFLYTETLHSGRMAPNTTICFLCAAFSIIFSRSRYIYLGLIGTMAIITTMVLIGYLTGTNATSSGEGSPMTIPAAIGFVLFAISLLVSTLQNNYLRFFDVWKALPIFTAIIFSCLTLLLWQNTRETTRQNNKQYFNDLIEDTTTAIHNRFSLYKQALLNGKGLFNASENISNREWQYYVKALEIDQSLPGINGIGFLEYVHAHKIQGYNSNKDQLLLKFIENRKDALHPKKGFLRGISIASQESLASGQPALTPKVELHQNHIPYTGFLLLVPIYQTLDVPDTPEERYKKIQGWVYAPFIGDRFLADITMLNDEQISFSIYDGEDVSSNNLIARSHLEEVETHHQFIEKTSLNIVGHKWTVVWKATPKFKASENDLTPYVLIVGFIITFFVTGIFHLLARLYGSTARILSENRKCLDLAVSIAGLGSWDWDVEANTVETNKRWVEMLNYSSKNNTFTIQGWQKLIHPDDLEVTAPLFDMPNSAQSKFCHIEFRMKRKPNSWCWISCRARVVGRDNNGLPTRIMGAHMDISDLKYAQTKIQQSEESFRNAMEYATIGMALITPKGKWLKVNKALCEIVGYKPKELIGKKFIDITHPNDVDDNWDYAQKLLGQEIKNYRIEKRYIHKDGHPVWVSISVSLVRSADNEPEYFISQIQDISEQKKAEEKIQTYLAELEQSNNELNDFCYIASHDLKEPLRAIHNYVQFMEEDYEKVLDEEGMKRLDRMSYLAKRMEKLISDLLYYSRIGRAKYAKRKTDINDAVKDVKEMLQVTFDRKDIVVEVEGKLPVLECDTVRITEVFRNLITNAVKYNDKDQKVITIGCKKNLQRGGEKYKNVLYVKDNGIGIPEEFREEVFRIFKRLHSVKEYGEGTGAGLTFVLKIIENHNGKIWIESEVGKGSTFYFTLGKL